jgi:hypothetical protein
MSIGKNYIWVAIFIFAFSGCGDKPNDVGIGLLPDDDLVKTVYIDSDSIKIEIEAVSFRSFISTSSSKNLFIGNFNEISSNIILKFKLPDTLKNISVRSARISLYTSENPIVGDTTGFLSFTVYKLISDIDSIYERIPVGSFSGRPDSVISFEIEAGVVEEWLSGENYGVLLKPDESSNMWSFKSFAEDFTPSLRIELASGDGKLDTLSFFDGESSYVARSSAGIDSSFITVQAGVGIRSIIKFDVSAIPRGVIINRAELYLYLKEKNFYSSGSDSLVISFITNPELIRHSLGGFDITTSEIGTRTLDDTTVYMFPITLPVQRWANGEVNNGLILRSYSEFENFNRFVFYYKERKPRVKIYYTTKPRI